LSTPAILALADGSLFYGTAIGADGETSGEVVFNTAMTGYQEILTDPSYSRQIVTLTYPHIGNTGVNEEDVESDRIQAAGLIIRDLPLLASSWRNKGSLDDYLRSNNIVGIADIDTRRLTRILRDKGSQNGAIVAGENATAERALELANAFPGLKGMDLAKDASKVKARIGVQIQSAAYFDYLSLEEILKLLGTFYPKSAPAGDLLDQVGLADQAKMRLNQLSGGQKQRFTVAASLVNDPELVILDEPTTGLDPQARRNLWGLIREVNGRGVTVVLTTHYMEEAETLCSRLAIMDHGRILALDTPRNLINQLKASYAVKLTLDKPMTVAQLESLNGGVELVQSEEQSEEATDEAAKSENTYLLRLANSPTALRAMLDEIDKAGLGLENLQITPVTLEDVFLELTGSELRD